MSRRVGIVGLGVISRFYIAAFDAVPGLELAAVCDVDDAALEPHEGRVACYRDHRALLRDAGLDAVIVNVPNDLHHGICRDALQTGHAVCVEKPLATELEDGRELSELADDRGLVLLTAFHRRYNEHVLALRDRVGATPVAELRVRYLELIEEHAGRDRWYMDPSRCGGGAVADNGPNAFDVVRLLLGDVELLDAEIDRDEADIDRFARVTLRSRDGALAHVELDWSYDSGECKDVAVRLADGRTDSADMLADCTEFKGSLWHEYVGVLRHFEALLSAGRRPGQGAIGELGRGDDGLAALRLVHEAYHAERPRSGAPVSQGDRG